MMQKKNVLTPEQCRDFALVMHICKVEPNESVNAARLTVNYIQNKFYVGYNGVSNEENLFSKP